MRFLGPIAFVVGASAFLAPRTTEKQPYLVPDSFDLVPNKFMVRLLDNHTLDDHFANIGVNVTDAAAAFTYWPRLNTYHFTLRDNQSEILHNAIRHDAGVKHVHQDYFLKVDVPDISGVPVVRRRQAVEVPSRVSKRWDDQSIIQRFGPWNQAMISNGWVQRDKYGLGVKRYYNPRDSHHDGLVKWEPGTGVNIYFFDTGIRLSHRIFMTYPTGGWSDWFGATKTRVRNFGDLKPSAQSPYCAKGISMEDKIGHGTHVAGIAVGAEQGTASSAYAVSVKVLCEGGTGTTAAQAVIDVIDEHERYKKSPPWKGWRGSVMNWSINFPIPPSDDILQRALKKATEVGIPIAAAAGNEDTTKLATPARYKSTISVGAVDYRYNRWVTPARGILPKSGSNHNSKLDVFAPGVNVESSFNTCDTCYTILNGTSQATPHVAGIMALMVGYEGVENLPHANMVYARLRTNYLSLVNDDSAMLRAKTKAHLAQTGIRYGAKHPYDGIPDNEDVSKRGVTSSRIPTNGDTPTTTYTYTMAVLPKKTVTVSDADSDNQMDGENKDSTPEAPTWEVCYDFDTDHDVDENHISGAISDFCEWAQAEARPAEGSKKISRKYNEDSSDIVTLTVEYDSPGVDFEVSERDCRYYLKDLILNKCKLGGSNRKAGGTVKVDQIMYSVDLF